MQVLQAVLQGSVGASSVMLVVLLSLFRQWTVLAKPTLRSVILALVGSIAGTAVVGLGVGLGMGTFVALGVGGLVGVLVGTSGVGLGVATIVGLGVGSWMTRRSE